MLVRAAHGGRPHRVISSWRRSASRIIVALFAVSLPINGCSSRGNLGPAVVVTSTLSPAVPVVGPAVLTVGVRDRAGAPVTKVAVRLEGHMSHAGMTPVLAHGTEREPGIYDVPFAFTMAGDWVLLVTATVGREGPVETRVNVPNVRASADAGASPASPANR